jgi:hypothetical protein
LPNIYATLVVAAASFAILHATAEDAGRSASEIQVPAPSGTNRVTAAALIDPGTARSGDAVKVRIKLRIKSGHWIYALENSGSHSLPTELIIPSELPLRAKGPWRGPEPKSKTDGSKTYAGEVVFERGFVVGAVEEKKTVKLPITIKYQVCNEALCWPPATISLEPSLTVIP